MRNTVAKLLRNNPELKDLSHAERKRMWRKMNTHERAKFHVFLNEKAPINPNKRK